MKAVVMMMVVGIVSGCKEVKSLVLQDLVYYCSKHGVEYVKSGHSLHISYMSDGSQARCTKGEEK
jgi:uncharacterized protein YceK